jgi:hypothetical protein
VFYSYGPTKEIMSVVLLYLIFDTEKKYIKNIGLALLFLLRPLFAIVYIAYLFCKSSFKRMILLGIVTSVVIPILYVNGYIFDGLITEPVKLSQEIDQLRYQYPIISNIGFLVAVLKNLLEPFIYVFRYGFTNILIDINLLAYLIALFVLINCFSQVRGIATYSGLTLFLISWYPLVQSRYIMVPLIVLIVIGYKNVCKYSSQSPVS